MAPRSYDDEQLAAAVAASHSWRGVLRHLGLKATSSAASRSVRRQAERLGLETSHFTGQRKWTEDALASAVAAARSWSEVAEALGLAGGSSTSALKGHAARLGIDASHFRRASAAPPGSPSPRPELANLGRSGSLLAAAWFSMCGYDVSWPLEPCRYDLVALRDADVLRVQVKTTWIKQSGSWVVMLSKSRRVRVVYDLDEIDHFFVIDGDFGYYLIPVASVGGLHAITLSAYEHFRVPRDPSVESVDQRT
jgi:hypothetical protein